MKYFKIVSRYLLVSLLYMNAFVPLTAWAQEQGSTALRVQPSIIEERADPGFVYSSVLRATNQGSQSQTFYITKRNMSGLSPIGTPIFSEEGEETGFEITAWIKIPTDPITILAGQTKEIPFSIEVPQDATPGGHFGGIFLTLAAERPKETGIGIGYQVGTIINLRISGEVFEEATMREFRTDRAIYNKPEVTFITRVENVGNVLVRPRGPLEITDSFGKRVATLRMNDAGSAVLPKQIRQFEILWEGEGLVFGRYQALLGLVYGEDARKNISAAVSFWVLPLNVIVPIIGVGLGSILTLLILVKFHIRRQLKKIRSATEEKIRPTRWGSVEREFLRYQKRAPLSRLALVTTAILVSTLIFLMLLFFFLA